MIGKESNNYFTPMQKLSDVAPAAQGTTKINELTSYPNIAGTRGNETEMQSGRNDLHGHPAFGFKAGLIRVIGNMSYKNQECQDLVSTDIL